MIYGLRRMIYLLCKYDIISVPFTCRRHISSAEGGYHIEDISPVPIGTDTLKKHAEACLCAEGTLSLKSEQYHRRMQKSTACRCIVLCLKELELADR